MSSLADMSTASFDDMTTSRLRRPGLDLAYRPSPAALLMPPRRSPTEIKRSWTVPAIVLTPPTATCSIPILIPAPPAPPACAVRAWPNRGDRRLATAAEAAAECATGFQLAGRGLADASKPTTAADDDDDKRLDAFSPSSSSSSRGPRERASFVHVFRRLAIGAAARQCRRRCNANAAATSWEQDVESAHLLPATASDEEEEQEPEVEEDEDGEEENWQHGGGSWSQPEGVPEPTLLHAYYQPAPRVAPQPPLSSKQYSVDQEEEEANNEPLNITAILSTILATGSHIMYTSLSSLPQSSTRSSTRSSSSVRRKNNTLAMLTTARLVLCFPIVIVLFHIYLSSLGMTLSGRSTGEVGSAVVGMRAIDALNGEMLGAAW